MNNYGTELLSFFQSILEKVGIQTFIGNLSVLLHALKATLATMMSTFPNNCINKLSYGNIFVKVQELTCHYGYPCREMQLHKLLEVHSDTMG